MHSPALLTWVETRQLDSPTTRHLSEAGVTRSTSVPAATLYLLLVELRYQYNCK